MGDLSYFREQEIEENNKEELITLGENGEYSSKVIDPNGVVDFSGWDYHKIEGYWYKEFVKELLEIAKHITGFVEFYCDYEYSFRIVFKDGKPYFHRQQPWDEISLGEIRERIK